MGIVSTNWRLIFNIDVEEKPRSAACERTGIAISDIAREMTAQEIGESILDDILDALFPADAAANEFIESMLRDVDVAIKKKGKSCLLVMGFGVKY